MTPESFVYWLQGFMEMADPVILDERQVETVRDHLTLVFDKLTPDRPASTVQEASTAPRDIKQTRIC